MPAFGQRPDTQFALRTTLDGTEEIYSQTGGVNYKFLTSAVATYVLSGASFNLFVTVNNEAGLPTGGAINTSKIYIVRNYNSTGKTVSLFYDSTISNWREITQAYNMYVVAANIAALPSTGDVDKLYHVIDVGNGRPGLYRWDATTTTYLTLDQDNNIYQVASVSARDALTGMQIGNVAIIADGDGNGNRGLSFYTGSAWTTPFLQLSNVSTAPNIATITSTTTLTTTNRIVIAYSSAGATDIRLPAPAACTGIPFTVKAGNLVNAIRVVPFSGGTIDGNANYTFSNANETITVISNGSNFFLI